MRRLKDIFRDKKAATAMEYGLILALIFMAMVIGVRAFADQTQLMWNNVSNAVARR